MRQRGWLARSRSARRERVLRSYSVAVASSTSSLGEPRSGAPDRRSYQSAWWITGTEDDARNRSERIPAPKRVAGAARRLAPGPWPASLVAASARNWLPERAGRIGPTLSGAIGADTKTVRSGPERRRRCFVSGDRVASLPNRCFTGAADRPSRRRQREQRREGPFFRAAKREARADRLAPAIQSRSSVFSALDEVKRMARSTNDHRHLRSQAARLTHRAERASGGRSFRSHELFDLLAPVAHEDDRGRRLTRRRRDHEKAPVRCDIECALRAGLESSFEQLLRRFAS